MPGAARGDYVTGWGGFVAMKQSTTPATTVTGPFSSEFSVCLLFISGTLTGTIYNIIDDIRLYLAFLRLLFMLNIMFLRFIYIYHM